MCLYLSSCTILLFLINNNLRFVIILKCYGEILDILLIYFIAANDYLLLKY